MSASEMLETRRAFECRLTPDRALATLEEAAAWVAERGLVDRAPDRALPSLHVACHEEPYAPGRPGFGRYPRTKWWWGWALDERPGLRGLKIRRGRAVLVSDAVAALVDRSRGRRSRVRTTGRSETTRGGSSGTSPTRVPRRSDRTQRRPAPRSRVRAIAPLTAGSVPLRPRLRPVAVSRASGS